VVADRRGVPGDRQVPAAVRRLRIHAAGSSPDADQLREFCAERIARYKAPRTVEVVDELPLSAVGKILKRTLREQYRAQP